MKKTIAPLPHPLQIEITPRLLAAVEASAGRKMPPGATLVMMPPPVPEMPPAMKPRPIKHPGQTCHLCGSKGYACEHIPGVPF